MKIEKINENQIKCTLNKSDLNSRQLKVSELAYGTEKTKMLFRDMMQQAATEFGFQADNLPLMIEAIPIPDESIILIITKVEEPEELDTRFSNFSPDTMDYEVEEEIFPEEDDESPYFDDMEVIDAEPETEESDPTLMEMFQQVRKKLEELKKNTTAAVDPDKRYFSVFSFQTLDEVFFAARQLSGRYQGENSLYKSKDDRYYLIMDKSSHSVSEFFAFCEVLSEFGTVEDSSTVSEAYYKEHFQVLLADHALQKLNFIS